MLAILLLLLGANRLAGVPERADMLEVNHASTFSQTIVWRWSHDYRRYDVVCWWLTEKLSHAPTHSFGRYTTDGKRRFAAPLFRETWTTQDPERINARLYPQELRQ